jgi:hypothetical protein
MRPGGAADRYCQGRRPPGEDADPADGRGETEPQENGHARRRLRAREAPAARRAAWSLHETGDPAAEAWVAVKALAVLAGDSGRVSKETAAEAGAAGLSGSQRNGTDACVRC